MDESDPAVVEYQEINRRFGIPDYLLVAISVPPSAERREQLVAWASRASERFRRLPGVAEIAYELPGEEARRLYEYYRRRALLFLAPAEVEALLQRLSTALSEMGGATLMTALTTAVGYASFLVAEFRGLSYLGLAGALGVMFCWLGSVLLLPPFLLLRQRRKC